MKKNKTSCLVTFQKIKFRLEEGFSATVGPFPVLASEITDGFSFLYTNKKKTRNSSQKSAQFQSKQINAGLTIHLRKFGENEIIGMSLPSRWQIVMNRQKIPLIGTITEENSIPWCKLDHYLFEVKGKVEI